MSVIVRMGRRVPKQWFKRHANKISGLLSFQEHIWNMISQSMDLGKRKCNKSGLGKWVKQRDEESESLNYKIEWQIHVIQGNKEFEKEEYEEAQNMYKDIGKTFKKDFPKDENLAKTFSSKVLSSVKIDDAYKKGYGSVKNGNLADKILEMGILTHIEWIDDFKTREADVKFDF